MAIPDLTDPKVAKEFAKRILAAYNRPVEPPRVLDARDKYADQVRVVYVETGEPVPDVFQYDLDRGECWQYVRGENGALEMSGREFKMRRVTGDLRAEWTGPDPYDDVGCYMIHDEIIYQDKPSPGMSLELAYARQMEAYRSAMFDCPWAEVEKRILIHDPETSLPNPCGEQFTATGRYRKE